MAGMKAEEVIERLDLTPLQGEGGFYRQTWLSDLLLEGAQIQEKYHEPKPAGSAIYFLLTKGEKGFSALHSLPTDEVYHFYCGSSVEIWLFFLEGRECRRVVLGNRLERGETPQLTVPAGCVQGSRLCEGEWALLGTTMAPAFTKRDFALADSDRLIRDFPHRKTVIEALSRKE